MQKYDPLKQEPEILEFWKRHKIREKSNERNKNGKKFYFLDGPPYTSGKVHIGTAWNKSLKDSILRYKRMQGFHVLDRAGYDMHGLPTENATERKLGISGKEAIARFGIANFIKACKELSIENMKAMNNDFERRGVWMDFENAYQSVKNEFIDGEWWLVKKAHEQGRLYEGFRSMAWDWAHQTAVAKHELEYKTIKDKSIFVKMKVKGKENEFLIIWTTTPWTIAYNLAIMVNPSLDYAKCKVENEIWIVAKALANAFIGSVAGKSFEIAEELKGDKLEGLEYEHPFYDELKEEYDKIKTKHPKAHTVVLSEEFVDTSAGTGLVHCAPGCGPEDYEVGHRNGLPPWNTVSEDGHYGENMGKFSGRHALKDNHTFIEELEERGTIVGQTIVEHEYPHGQRSHKPVIFRATRQWFFRVEDIKDEMIKENDKIQWNPKAGYNAFSSWLNNLRDNSISKQRYWGTPLPVWRNVEDAHDYIVVGSIKELEELSGRKVEEPHIPWIDEITIKKGGKEYKRVPDVLDVWVDAGCASWNSLDFPQKMEDFEKYYPADFILEGKDQIRGWFNLLHVASMISMKRPSFKAVYMHGFVQDALGRKMSKSLGNYILPEEVISRHGADALRYYCIGGADAGLDLNYNFDDMKVKVKNLMVLWNLQNYVLDMARNLGVNPKGLKSGKLELEEKYIFSKLHSAIRKVTELSDEYKLNETPWPVERLYLELSRTYIQLTRDKSAVGNEEEKKTVLYTVYNVFLESLKMLSPIAPFITEAIYQNLKNEFKLEEESVHLCGWPAFDEKFIDAELEENMEVASGIIQSALSLREKIQQGTRWPLKEIVIATKDGKIVKAAESMKEAIKTQANIKEITILENLPGIRLSAKPDFAQLGPDFGKDAPKIIAKLALESPETILGHIEKEGKYAAKIDDKEFNIVKEHLIVERKVPDKYAEAAFRGGFVYLNREIDDELEAEGFAREVMRRVQALRKEAGLQKPDKIHLFIKADEELKAMLAKWNDAIAEKVNASLLKIAETDPNKKLPFSSAEKVKGREFGLFLEKV